MKTNIPPCRWSVLRSEPCLLKANMLVFFCESKPQRKPTCTCTYKLNTYSRKHCGQHLNPVLTTEPQDCKGTCTAFTTGLHRYNLTSKPVLPKIILIIKMLVCQKHFFKIINVLFKTNFDSTFLLFLIFHKSSPCKLKLTHYLNQNALS